MMRRLAVLVVMVALTGPGCGLFGGVKDKAKGPLGLGGDLGELLGTLGPLLDPTGAGVAAAPREVAVTFVAQHADFLPADGEVVLVGEGRRTYALHCTKGTCGEIKVATTGATVQLFAVHLAGGKGTLLGPVQMYRDGAGWRGVVVMP